MRRLPRSHASGRRAGRTDIHGVRSATASGSTSTRVFCSAGRSPIRSSARREDVEGVARSFDVVREDEHVVHPPDVSETRYRQTLDVDRRQDRVREDGGWCGPDREASDTVLGEPAQGRPRLAGRPAPRSRGHRASPRGPVRAIERVAVVHVGRPARAPARAASSSTSAPEAGACVRPRLQADRRRVAHEPGRPGWRRRSRGRARLDRRHERHRPRAAYAPRRPGSDARASGHRRASAPTRAARGAADRSSTPLSSPDPGEGGPRPTMRCSHGPSLPAQSAGRAGCRLGRRTGRGYDALTCSTSAISRSSRRCRTTPGRPMRTSAAASGSPPSSVHERVRKLEQAGVIRALPGRARPPRRSAWTSPPSSPSRRSTRASPTTSPSASRSSPRSTTATASPARPTTS